MTLSFSSNCMRPKIFKINLLKFKMNSNQDQMRFLRQIQHSSFINVDISGHPATQIEGWMAQEFQQHFMQALKYVNTNNPVIIEVGTWKGLSANTMARICKTERKEPVIVCIDTWLGSPEHMEGESSSAGMERVNGLPTLFQTFLKNTKAHGNDDVIYPFPIASTQGAHYLTGKDMQADIIYIDAGHEYEAVLMDIKLYWKLLKNGGVMIFDDWRWPGVQKAIKEFANLHPDSHLNVGELQAYMIKSSHILCTSTSTSNAL